MTVPAAVADGEKTGTLSKDDRDPGLVIDAWTLPEDIDVKGKKAEAPKKARRKQEREERTKIEGREPSFSLELPPPTPKKKEKRPSRP